MSLKKKLQKCEKVRNLKVKNLQVQSGSFCSLNANTATISDLTANTATISDLTSTNATIDNLYITSLNGKDNSCPSQTFVNSNLQLIPVVNGSTGDTGPIQPGNTAGFNQDVLNKLWDITLIQKAEFEQRNLCGRLEIRAIQKDNGCIVCPPDGYENCSPIASGNTGSTCDGNCDFFPDGPSGAASCPIVPVEIYGMQTVSAFTQQVCASELTTQLLSTVSYNLDVINLTGTLSTRLVSVLVQAGYLDENSNFVYEQIDFGTRQFGAVIDTCYGEKYTGTVVLPTKLIEDMTTAALTLSSQNPNSSVIQMIVFNEEGVAIDIQTPLTQSTNKFLNKFRSRQNTANLANTTASGAMDVQSVENNVAAVNNSNPNAIVSLTYTPQGLSGEITSLVSNVVVNNAVLTSGQIFQNVLAFNLIDTANNNTVVGSGNINLGLNFNIPDLQGSYLLATIYQAGISATPDPGVTQTTVPSRSGIRLQRSIPDSQIVGGSFPLSIIKIGDVFSFNTLGTIQMRSPTIQIDPTSIVTFVQYTGTNSCATIPRIDVTIAWPVINNSGSIPPNPWTQPPTMCGTGTVVSANDSTNITLKGTSVP